MSERCMILTDASVTASHVDAIEYSLANTSQIEERHVLIR